LPALYVSGHRLILEMLMLSRNAIGVSLLLLTAAAALPSGGAAAQQDEQDGLVGAWQLVLVDNVLADGSRVHLYGPNPQGLVIFDTTGHYALQIMSAGRPKFAANDKSKGTADEYRAAVQGSNCHYGTYRIDDANKTITLHVEGATFANWESTNLVWPFTVGRDESKFTVPHPTTGGPGATGEIVWKRLR
jgi:hypothetical protein